MKFLFMPLAIAAGSLMVIQAACNSALERAWDRPVTVAVTSLSIGISVLVVVGFALGQLGLPTGKATQPPWWAWLGGACGAISLLSQPLAAPRLGAALRNRLFHRLCGRRSFWVARLRSTSGWDRPNIGLCLDGGRNRFSIGFLARPRGLARAAEHLMENAHNRKAPSITARVGRPVPRRRNSAPAFLLCGAITLWENRLLSVCWRRPRRLGARFRGRLLFS